MDQCQEIEVCKVSYKDGVGNCLVAARNIKATEEVLVDHPAIIAPYHDPQPMCIECLRKTDGQMTCSSCDLPLCRDSRCKDGPQHGGQECHYWSELSQRVQIPRWRMNKSN